MNLSNKLIMLILVSALLNTPGVQGLDDLDGTMKRQNFTDTKWVQSMNNLTLNNSRLILENYNASGIYENFTAYTEYEETLDYITDINETHFRCKADLRYGRYMVNDYGAGYFENFTITFGFLINGIGNTGLNDHFFFILQNQTLGDWDDFDQDADSYYTFRVRDDTTENKQVIVYCRHEGVAYHNGWTVDNTLDDDWLYIKIIKTGDTVNTTIYDNSDFTGLHWTDEITFPESTDYRYLYAVNSQDLNLYPGYYIDVWVKELDIGTQAELYYPTGSLYTTDILENVTVNAESLLYEGVTPTDTSIECYYSDDNSTWTGLDNGAWVNDENLSSVYLWLRLNTTGSGTPYVDYYQVFYESPPGRGVAVVLFILGVLIGIGVNRK